MIIDVHGHLGHINMAPSWDADSEELEVILQDANVDKLCISSAKSLMYDTCEGNRDLATALLDSERLLGYAVINPVFPETLSELEYLNNPQFIGVKIHPDYHGYDMKSASVVRFLDKVAEQTKLMLFHTSCMPGTGFSDAVTIAEFASRHPNTNFILAHMAGVFQNSKYPYFPNFSRCEKVAAMELDNVYIDTAHHLMYVYPGVMERMLELVGADHIVFGTDTPLQGAMQIRFAIETIRALDIPEYDKEKILYENAKIILEL